MQTAQRLDGIEISLIRQINALATPDSINLGIGEPNLQPDDTLQDFARRAACLPWQYSPNAGKPRLREKIAASVGASAADQVCVTAGTQEALFAIFQAYAGPGDEVLVPDPGFVSYGTVARMSGAAPVTYRLNTPDWTIDVGAIPFSARTKLIIVNSPSNPLGAVQSAETLRAIASAAERHGALVVSDEVYRQIWYDVEPVSMHGMSPNVLVIDGMSKSHGMTGLRLGWVIGTGEIVKPVVTAHQYIATCASVFAQDLADLVMRDAEWNRSWLAAARAQFARQREAALYAIEHDLEIVLNPPRGAFYAFVPVPSCDTLDFAKNLATDAGVLVIPGVAFGREGEGFIRISYASPPEKIATGIERIGRYLREIGR